jgi:hypothetical protein
MAGHICPDDSPEEDRSFLSILYFNLENQLLSNLNLERKSPQSLPHRAGTSATSSPDALITAAPVPLELRQNNPQDCSNLIIASVDRATVEISRTIIALNATFSQQLQQVSQSATSGINSAKNSASSTIAVVVQSASVATSSAFSIATVARLAVTSANLALTSANAAETSASLSLASLSSVSSSDVAGLSSTITLLQASVISLQVSSCILKDGCC